MNKNLVYLPVFGILCVTAGVMVGESIARRPHLPWPGAQRPDFRERAEGFMGYGRRHPAGKRGGEGLVEMLNVKLGLSAEQKVKVTLILEDARQKIDAAGRDVRNTLENIKQDADKQIMGVLNSQQQKKFNNLQRMFKKDREGSRHGPFQGGPRLPGGELPPPPLQE